MSETINAPVTGGPELPKPGQYLLYCYSIIVIGEIKGYQDNLQKKIMFIFELPQTSAVFNEEKGAQPFVVHQEFTHSLHKQSNMRPFIDQWRGKKMTDDEAKTLNLAEMVKIPALASIIHGESKKGKLYLDINGIAPAYGAKDLPPRSNPLMIWSWNTPFNQEKFLSIPLWIINIMIGSTEFARLGIPIPMLPNEVWDQQSWKVKRAEQNQTAPQGNAGPPQGQVNPPQGNVNSPQGNAPQPPVGNQPPAGGQPKQENPFLNGQEDEGQAPGQGSYESDWNIPE